MVAFSSLPFVGQQGHEFPGLMIFDDGLPCEVPGRNLGITVERHQPAEILIVVGQGAEVQAFDLSGVLVSPV